MADNRIVIDTKMENRGIIKGVRDATRQLEKVTDGYKGANAQIQLQKDGIQRLNDQLAAARQEAVKIGEAYAKAKAELPTKRPTTDVESYEKQRLEVERINQEYREANKNVSSLSGELRKSTLELNRLSGEASSYQFLQTEAAEKLVQAQERLVAAQSQKTAALREETELVQTSQNTWTAMTAEQKAHWEENKAVISETAGAVDNVTQSINEQAQAAERVSSVVRETRNENWEMAQEAAKIEYSQLSQSLVDAQTRVDEISNKLTELQENGKSPRGIASMKRDLEDSTSEISDLKAQLSTLVEFHAMDIMQGIGINPQRAEDASRLSGEIERLSLNISSVAQSAAKMDALPSAIEKTISPTKAQTSILRELASVAASVGSGIRKAFSGAVSIIGKFGTKLLGIGGIFKGIHRNSRTASTGIERFGKRIFRLAAAALVFNQIRRALRSLVSYYGDALKQNEQLYASFALLKGSALTAFQPLFEVAIPIIATFVQWLATAIQYLGTFISMLFKVDPKQMQANAKATWDNVKGLKAGKKAAEKFLAPWDEITKISEDAAGAGADMSEVISDFDWDIPELPPWLKNLADWFIPIVDGIKDAWSSLYDSIISAFNRWKDELLAAWKKMTDSIKALILSIIDTFKRLFETDIWSAFLDEVFRLFRNIMNLITAIADAFRKAWDMDDRGLKLLEAITRMCEEILGLINDIIEAFIKAWNENDRGVKIFANILEIITNVADTIANLAEQFRKAWNENELGVRIWGLLFDIVNSILTTINNITKATADWAANVNFTPLLEGFANLLESIKPVVDIILDGLAWAYNNVLLPIGTWLIELAVPTALDMLSKAFDLLLITLEKLKPVALWLWENFLKPLAEWAGHTVVDTLSKAFDVLVESIKFVIENAEFLLTMITPLVAAFVAFKATLAIQALVTALSTAMSSFSIAAALAAAKTWLLNSALLANPIALIVAAIAGLIVALVLLVKNWDYVKEGAAKAWEGIKAVWGKVVDFFKSIVDGIKKVFGIHSPSKVMADIGINIIQGLMNGINSLIGNVTAKAKEIATNITNALSNVVSNAKTIGGNIANAIGTGLNNAKNAVVNTAKKVAGAITGGTEDKFKIQSPSKVFMQIGEYLGQGLGIGFENTAGLIKSAFTDTIGDAGDDVDGMENQGYSIGMSLLNGLELAYTPIVDFFRNLMADIQSVISASLPTIPQISIPQLPRAGFLDNATISSLADKGRNIGTTNAGIDNAVYMERLNRIQEQQEIQSSLLRTIIETMASSGGNERMDIKTLTDSVTERIRAEQMRTNRGLGLA